MKNKVIIIISSILVIGMIALILLNKPSQDIKDSYVSDTSEVSNIVRDDSIITSDEYITYESNETKFSMVDGDVIHASINDYLQSEGYNTGYVLSHKCGSNLLDGEEVWYSEEYLYIKEQYPDWEDDFYYEYIDYANNVNFFMIILDNKVIDITY